MSEQPLDVWVPDRFSSGLRREQDDALPLVQDQAFDEHEAHEGLAEADAVAEERPSVPAGDLQQRPVGLLLVAVETGEHLRLVLVPLAGRQFMAAKVFLQRLGVDLEGREGTHMALDRPDDRVGGRPGPLPVLLEPVPELRDLAGALDLDIEFDVLRQSGLREIARTDQCLRPDDVHLAVGEVGLCVELRPVVDAALDLTALQRLQHRRDAVEERVVVLRGLDAPVEFPDGALLRFL